MWKTSHNTTHNLNRCYMSARLKYSEKCDKYQDPSDTQERHHYYSSIDQMMLSTRCQDSGDE